MTFLFVICFIFGIVPFFLVIVIHFQEFSIQRTLCFREGCFLQSHKSPIPLLPSSHSLHHSFLPSLPFHSFRVFISTVLFQLNLGLSMDSTAFVFSLLISLSSSITSSSIFPFISSSSIDLGYNSLVFIPSDVFDGLSSLNSLHFFSFPLISSFPFHSLSSLSSSGS